MSNLDQCNEIYELKDKALIYTKKINNVERKSFFSSTQSDPFCSKNYEGMSFFGK